MDHYIVENVMDFIGSNGYGEVGSLFESEQDIADQIYKVYPEFDVKGSLIHMLESARIIRSLCNTSAYNIFMFMKNIPNIDYYSIYILHNVIDISLSSNCLFDVSIIKNKFPSAAITHNEYEPIETITDEGRRVPPKHYVQFRYQGKDSDKDLIKDTRALAQHLARYIDTNKSDVCTIVIFDIERYNSMFI